MPRTPASQDTLARFLKLHPKYIDLSLDRMHGLLARLDHPEHDLPPVIHIAGTNGKGSTLAYLKAIMSAAGKRVHAYSSPHLVKFHERINLAGVDISEEELAALLAEVETKNSGQPITFFEATTAVALTAFARHPADYLLLEVGLGGRLDATNVVDTPRLSLITPVSMDHEQFLGANLADIAGEKAGILKPGCKALIARQESEALQVIQARADAVNAPTLYAGRDWEYTRTEDGMKLSVQDISVRLPEPGLTGTHQYENAALAAVASRELGIPLDAIRQGVAEADWPARLQPIPPLPGVPEREDLWLDGGHNPAAAHVLANWVTGWQKERPQKPFHMISGMLNTKQAESYFTAFRGLDITLTTLTIPGEQNSLTAAQLAYAARQAGLQAEAGDSLAAAVQAAPDGARILICGSLYLAGHVLSFYK